MRAPFLALVLLASPALGAPPPSSASPAAPGSKAKAGDPSEPARALSRALVPEPNWERLIDRSADGLSEAVARSLMAKGETVPDGLKADLRRELAKDLKYSEAIEAQAQALDKRFTGDELKKATAFYSSPVGKKMLDRLPDAQSEVGDALQERLASVVPGILERVAPSAVGGSPGPDTGTGEGPEAIEPEQVEPEVPEAPPPGDALPEKKL